MYNKIIRERVRVRPKEREMCWTFARQVIGTNKQAYARRGQTQESRIIQQIARGKIAEFAVFSHIHFSVDVPVAFPDLSIYTANEKSYAADLRVRDMDVHVKSQTFKNRDRYGASWVFQKRDPLLTKPNQSDLLALTHQHAADSEYVEIVGYFYAIDIVGLYGDPVLPYLRRTKKVLYLDDLLEVFPEDG